jgi:hypothetical protein
MPGTSRRQEAAQGSTGSAKGVEAKARRRTVGIRRPVRVGQE